MMGEVGSKAYGTSTPESDDDYMGVCIAPLAHYTGLENWGTSGTIERKSADGHEDDLVVYELKKFVKLALLWNPNVIPLLWLEDYIILKPAGRYLIENRNLFVSAHSYTRILRYSQDQLDSVKRGVTGKYGDKRKQLIQKYGYDVKFAYHTIRLLRMLAEFLVAYKAGNPMLNVYRSEDREELLAIRQGKWTQEEFFQNAENLMYQVALLRDGVNFPQDADYAKINEMVMNIIEEEYWNENR